ncbi:phenylalanine--tRNA ligase subunit alpha [Candidatus Woesearchaeota archaeon]|nr:phenylalanine--tRNA ligase subunit alpha [Candidatus Woesearchaeota archaeon]MBW3022021.1 phenylalanine--tRNA ligase subunit alpha [Candidatus Woesearchaeota archaeon]
MDIKNLAETLHPLERKVVPLLSKYSDYQDLVKHSALKDVEVMRALQWLQNKKVIGLKEELQQLVKLDKNGKRYEKDGLPEIRFLRSLTTKPKPVEEIIKTSKIDPSELNICIGMLKKKAAIDIKKDGKQLSISITPNGEKLLKKPTFEELLLKALPKEISKLSPEEKFAFDNLKSRKNIVKVDIVKIKTVTLTDLGKKLTTIKIDTKVIDKVTPKMLSSGSWKGKPFRRYDVEINVPRISGGRRHFTKVAADYAKQIWLNMGFKEMTGPMLDTSFWIFDSLFTAQDHPVREMQDTFFVKEPVKGNLPDKKLVNAVRKSHEKGTEGSTGWQYKWSEEEAKKNVLRTHTTGISARTISKLKDEDLPAKFFALGRCFRNETMDWSHLFELNQTEGIVIDPNSNFRHLLGYLKQFFKQMGFPDARFRPAHFPYTEPSVEIDVWHPVHNTWMELGGAGIFRPEVVEPLLGKFVPILAWGPGFDRIILEYFDIKDIRDLYKNDIKQLREIKYWLK